jgi:hypothetical protein
MYADRQPHQQQQQLELQCPVQQDTAVPHSDQAEHGLAAVELPDTARTGDHGSKNSLTGSATPELASTGLIAAPVEVTTLGNQDEIGADSSSGASAGLQLPTLRSTAEVQMDASKGLKPQQGSAEESASKNTQAAHHAQAYTAAGNTQQHGGAIATRPPKLTRDDSIGPFAQAALLPFGSIDRRWTFSSWSRRHSGSAGSQSECWLQSSMSDCSEMHYYTAFS